MCIRDRYEIAKAMKENGFNTTLITGPTNLEPIEGVKMINVNSGKEMLDKTLQSLPSDVAIFSAAVSDFRVDQFRELKIKKTEQTKLDLIKNRDILKSIPNPSKEPAPLCKE